MRPATPHSPALPRRRVLAGLGLAVACATLRTPARGQQQVDGFRILRAQPGSAHLRGADLPPTAICGYDGIVPGPVLRVTRGDELRLRLVNDLPEATTVHWHGVRVPNAMDGVPHLTQ